MTLIWFEEAQNLLKREDCEYYVHYSNFDRRLDEWVSFDRIDTNTQVSSGESFSDKNSRDSSVKGKKQKVNNDLIAAYSLFSFMYTS